MNIKLLYLSIVSQFILIIFGLIMNIEALLKVGLFLPLMVGLFTRAEEPKKLIKVKSYFKTK